MIEKKDLMYLFIIVLLIVMIYILLYNRDAAIDKCDEQWRNKLIDNGYGYIIGMPLIEQIEGWEYEQDNNWSGGVG